MRIGPVRLTALRRLPARQALLFLCVAGLSVLSGPVSASAQTDSPEASDGSDVPSASPAVGQPGPAIAVKLGFDGAAKVGGWLPVQVQVSNDGSSITGELQIEIDDSGVNRQRAFNARPTSVYTVPASLPSHSRKQYEIDVFLPFPTKALTVKLATDQGVLVQQTAQLQALSASEVLCGTLARNQDFFQQLKNLDLPGRQGKKPFVVAMKPEDVPPRQYAMSSLDCLIVNNVSLTGLTDDQKGAILGWVENGGLLVLGGGSGWQKTFQPLPKELLPVDVSGVRSVPSLSSLADFAHQPIKGDGPWLVSTGKLVDGEVVVDQNGIPIMVGAKRGKGTVLYLAADPTSEPLNTWNGNAALWKYIMAYNSTPLAVFPFFNSFGGLATIQNWGQPPRTAIFNIAGVDPPSVRWLILFIALYALVLGPLNFLLLHVSGHKALGWVTVPVLILAGALVTHRFAELYRGSDIILNKISVIRSEGNSVEANVRSYVSLYTPRKGDFSVLVPGNASVTSYARPAASTSSGSPDVTPPWVLKVNESTVQNRIAMPLEGSSTGSFLADSQVRLPGKFTSELKVNGESLSGAIVNKTGQPVDDVVLALGGAVQYVGRMNNGERKIVSLAFDPQAPSTGPDSAKVKAALTGSSSQSETTRTNRESILDAFLGSSTSAQPAGLSGLTLLGWMPSSPLPLQVADQHPSVNETNLFVTSLGFSFPRGASVVVPPALIGTKQIGTFSTNFQRPGQYDLNPAGSLAIEFSLPVRATDMMSNNLVLHMVGHYAGNQRLSARATAGDPLGQIYLYNWQSADWDAQDFAWGDNPIADPAPYLSATGALRLRYTYKPPPQLPTASLQFSLDLTDEGQLR